jgi:hypothetical protein
MKSWSDVDFVKKMRYYIYGVRYRSLSKSLLIVVILVDFS